MDEDGPNATRLEAETESAADAEDDGDVADADAASDASDASDVSNADAALDSDASESAAASDSDTAPDSTAPAEPTDTDPAGDGDAADVDATDDPAGDVPDDPTVDASDGDDDASGHETEPDDTGGGSMPGVPDPEPQEHDVPEDVRKYARFKKMDGAQYERVNEFLRERTYITAREWAIARLCSDFRTETGVEMTKIGENLPELIPFMTDTYTPQAVNQARSSFEDKVRTAGATFLYGAMCDFFTAEELDDVMYEATEVAKFLLEVEGVDLSVEDELEAEERISSVMREVREASEELRERDDE
ncbi:DUF5806 family protein [Natrinema sp. DC36]|uniref:DUF5806 family protein n=1 Tax=Natrinema sp. DC36 TaxID=2878680 RepID=UPI001CEFBA9B|nr:DUF5806 family protein [Natrinema sp. DC36]